MSNTKLSAKEKMTLWHNGQRKQNVKQMGDDKLVNSYNICIELGYSNEADILKTEMNARGL